MKKNWLIEACIIALSVVVLAFCLKGGIDNFVNKDRIVSVKGLSEVEVAADKVISQLFSVKWEMTCPLCITG